MEASKNLLKVLESSLSELSLPLSQDLTDAVKAFQVAYNNDESIEFLKSNKFINELYNLFSKEKSQRREVQVALGHLLTLLSFIFLDFDTLLFWINEYATFALNSPGISNDLVVASRYFLKSILSVSSTESKQSKIAQIQLHNSCLVFRMLLNLYLENSLVFYEKDHLMTIVFDSKLSPKVNPVPYGNSKAIESIDENISVTIESFEAKRFINLNIRPLLLEFMIYYPKHAFAILNEYVEDIYHRLDTLSLVATLINPDSSVLNLEILKSDLNLQDSKEVPYFRKLINIICTTDDDKRLAIDDPILRSRVNQIYNTTLQNRGDFKIDLFSAFSTKFVESICNILLFDCDVVTINHAIFLLMPLIVSMFGQSKKIVSLLLLIFTRLSSYESNIASFFHFDYQKTSEVVTESLNCFQEEVFDAKSGSESSEEFPDKHLGWVCAFVNASGCSFDFSQISKLYSVMYGLYPNVTTKFIKSPQEFFSKYLKKHLKSFIDKTSLSFFDESDIILNTRKISRSHLLNPDLLECSVEKELESIDSLSWQTSSYKLSNPSKLLWYCLQFDKNINMKFYYPPEYIVSLNIIKLLTGENDIDAAFKKSSSKEEEISRFWDLVRFFKIQVEDSLVNSGSSSYFGASTGFGSGNGTSLISPSISPGIKVIESPELKPLFKSNFSLNKGKERKHSIKSITDLSLKDFGSQTYLDVGSLLHKQTSLYVGKEDLTNDSTTVPNLESSSNVDSPAVGPTSVSNSPSLVPLDPEGSSQFSKHRSELVQSLNFYRRELLLMKNDLDFSNLVRSMVSAELFRARNTNNKALLDSTKANKLSLLKLEDSKYRKDQVQSDMKKLTKALAAARANAKIQDGINTTKLNKLKAEIGELNAEQSETKRLIESQKKHIEELKKHTSERDNLVIKLQNRITFAESHRKIEQIGKTAETNTEISVLEKTEDYQTIDSLRKEVKKLIESTHFYKSSEKELKKRILTFEKQHTTDKKKYTSQLEKLRSDLESLHETQMNKKAKELSEMSEKYKKLKKLYVKQQRVFAKANEELLDTQINSISLRDDMAPSFVDEYYGDTQSLFSGGTRGKSSDRSPSNGRSPSNDDSRNVKHVANGLYFDDRNLKASVHLNNDNVTIDSRITPIPSIDKST